MQGKVYAGNGTQRYRYATLGKHEVFGETQMILNVKSRYCYWHGLEDSTPVHILKIYSRDFYSIGIKYPKDCQIVLKNYEFRRKEWKQLK